MKILDVDHVTMKFGGLTAVNDVSMFLDKGELVGLIGPNGAGKTTLFNMLTGVYSPTEGSIYIDFGTKKKINGLAPDKIANLGLARTFQNIRLFKKMTVLDNVLVAMNSKNKCGVLSSILRLPKFYKTEKILKKEAIQLLKIFDLDNKKDELASNLPYGEQRCLEIVRALALKPNILFLDEPAAGMNPQETDHLTQLIHQIRNDFNMTILLIEHDMSLVMSICERIYVLDSGELIASGTAQEVRNNPKVIKAYLGEEV